MSKTPPRLEPSAIADSKVLRADRIKSVGGINIWDIPMVDTLHRRGKLYADKYGDYNSIRVRADVTLEDFEWIRG